MQSSTQKLQLIPLDTGLDLDLGPSHGFWLLKQPHVSVCVFLKTFFGWGVLCEAVSEVEIRKTVPLRKLRYGYRLTHLDSWDGLAILFLFFCVCVSWYRTGVKRTWLTIGNILCGPADGGREKHRVVDGWPRPRSSGRFAIIHTRNLSILARTGCLTCYPLVSAVDVQPLHAEAGRFSGLHQELVFPGNSSSKLSDWRFHASKNRFLGPVHNVRLMEA